MMMLPLRSAAMIPSADELMSLSKKSLVCRLSRKHLPDPQRQLARHRGTVYEVCGAELLCSDGEFGIAAVYQGNGGYPPRDDSPQRVETIGVGEINDCQLPALVPCRIALRKAF